MSLSDLFNFEMFNLKDVGKGLGKHPLQKLLFGIDPLGTKIGNTITGNEDEPLVDQLGGAYGGKVISMGNPTGGVYGRAQQAGIDTSSGAGVQDLAHLIAASYATGGLLGNGGGQTNPTGVGPFGNQPPPSPQGATPPIFSQGGSGFQDLQKLQQLQGLLGGGQQQQPGQAPATVSLSQTAGRSAQDIAEQQRLMRLKAKPYKSPADFAVLARAGLLG